jgi:hypothetical protein
VSFAIGVQRVRVRLRRMGGGENEAVLFVHTVGHHGHRPQTVAERLNQEREEFLAAEIEGRVSLVRIDSIAVVELEEAPAEVEAFDQTGGTRHPVELRLATGDRLAGELLYQAPEAQQRVIDLLNVGRERFLLLRLGERYLLVRRDAIDQVNDP